VYRHRIVSRPYLSVAVEIFTRMAIFRAELNNIDATGYDVKLYQGGERPRYSAGTKQNDLVAKATASLDRPGYPPPHKKVPPIGTVLP
jgi:hypothetical protein